MATLPSYDDALAMILPHTPPLRDECVALGAALGRVLRRDVVADRDQPPFDRSAMDGFAVRSSELAQPGHDRLIPIDGGVAAGGAPSTFLDPMKPGTVKRIATGAPLPNGADAVIPIEVAIVEGERVKFAVDRVTPWQNVHRRASDAGRGVVVLRAGTRLRGQHIGIAAAVGAADLVVAEVPRITLITTGDEVVHFNTPTDALEPQQIRNSNGPMLRALLDTLGTPLLHHEHVADEPQVTLAAAREALAHSHLVVTVGGVSVGQRDFLPSAWQSLGLTPVVHGVNIQPGKPVLVVRDDCKLVLGLPGNPVSIFTTAHLFLWPVLRRMLFVGGEGGAALPWRNVRLAAPTKPNAKRQMFRAATLDGDGQATVIQWHGSGDLMHTAEADGFVRLPLRDEPLEAGATVAFLPLMY